MNVETLLKKKIRLLKVTGLVQGLFSDTETISSVPVVMLPPEIVWVTHQKQQASLMD